MVYSAVSCNFGVLSGEDEHTSFYSAILESNQSSFSLRKDEFIRWPYRSLLSSPGNSFNFTVTQVYAPTCNAEEDEDEQFL